MASPVSVVALLAAYNEADIIRDVVSHLFAQGVHVYFLDDGSTDGTAEAIEPFIGRGVIGLERLKASEGSRSFDWAGILQRKAQLASELDADWFIHQDADEFRESPWPDLTLQEGIQRVDAGGYNAIDFLSLDFWPTGDDWQPGRDIRRAFMCYSPAAQYDRLQIRCWKKTDTPVDLMSSGGHEAVFEGRRVFPLRFLSRHYPIRGQAHGERKIFRDRQPRFLESELARGWHVQYKDVRPGEVLVRDPATLTTYDPQAVKWSLQITHRDEEALRAQLEGVATVLNSLKSIYEKVGRVRLDGNGNGVLPALAMLKEDHERIGADLSALKRENAALREQGVAVQAVLDQLQTREAATSLELRSLRAEVAARSLDLNQALLELQHVKDVAESYRAGADALSNELVQARNESSALASECDRYREEILDGRRRQETTQAERDHAQHRLDDVLQSRSWRWTAPVRALLDRLKPE